MVLPTAKFTEMLRSTLRILSIMAVCGTLVSCAEFATPKPQVADAFLWKTTKFDLPAGQDFKWKTEQFADLKIIRYQVPGFDELPVQKKKLLYYLYMAAVSGRDIIYDQNYRHNLLIRRSLENIYNTYTGDRAGWQWHAFHVYLKRVWFANGIHHHYSYKKFEPGFTREYFAKLIKNSQTSGFHIGENESIDDLISFLSLIIFEEDIDPKRVSKDASADLITSSATNFYEGLNQSDVEEFYTNIRDTTDKTPVSYGLNSKLVRGEDGKPKEIVWKEDGMYGEAIKEITYWLTQASTVAENENQRRAFQLLIKFYRSGDLADFDDYCVAWLRDQNSDIDLINGFIEVYGDPLGFKGSYESVVQVKDPIASEKMQIIAKEAQWFEDNSPIMDEHKKSQVVGISYNMINVVMESGDASPSTPIGINLPNSSWIRKTQGSKSVSLANITNAYSQAGGSSILAEFCYSKEEMDRALEHDELSGKLHTAMHEVIGHASGQEMPGVGSYKQVLKNYASTLEEGRADLVALYYLMDQKLIDLGVMPDFEVGKAEYDGYIRNGLMLQLRRLEIGDVVEEDHMRNRQMIAKWCYEKGKADNVIEMKKENGKTYFVINDYQKLRKLFGDLLREVQRIKSEGDFEAGKNLVENYGVQVDQALHQEVLDRTESLGLAPYGGFINPKLVPVMDAAGNIIDVNIEYPDDFTEQHLEYSSKHSHLPTYN